MTVMPDDMLAEHERRIAELETVIRDLRAERTDALQPNGAHPYRSPWGPSPRQPPMYVPLPGPALTYAEAAALARSSLMVASTTDVRLAGRPGVAKRIWEALGGKRGPVPDVLGIVTGATIWISFAPLGSSGSRILLGAAVSIAFTACSALAVERWRERRP
jgi:hypothetical protein